MTAQNCNIYIAYNITFCNYCFREVCLKEMAKLGNERKTSSYDNFVSKIFDKTKKLLKLLNMPGDSIVDNFPKFIDEASV